MKEDLLAYKREVETGNPKVNRGPEALQLADRLLGAESVEEFMDILKEHDANANAKQGV
jgi:hypothetical protein